MKNRFFTVQTYTVYIAYSQNYTTEGRHSQGRKRIVNLHSCFTIYNSREKNIFMFVVKLMWLLYHLSPLIRLKKIQRLCVLIPTQFLPQAYDQIPFTTYAFKQLLRFGSMLNIFKNGQCCINFINTLYLMSSTISFY